MRLSRFPLFLPPLLLTLEQSANARTIFVSPDGENSTGETWQEAFQSAAIAIDSASIGDEIWVKKGAYGTFFLQPGIKVYGGFAGTEALDEFHLRNWQRNAVTIDTGFRAVSMAEETLIHGVLITGGEALHDGGGVVCSGVNTIANCRIPGNPHRDRGGGVMVSRDATVTMTN